MPPVVVERPKMTRALWESLKANIMRERERKKQELEANAEVERQRKERERQQKQEAMTLTETREQIGKLEAHLTELKAEKHQLFLQLKKVLNEDEMRRRKESELMNMNYHNSGGQGQPQQQMGPTAAQMFLQPLTLTRPSLYKGGPMPPQHMQHGQPTLIPQGVKRSRSPSPPSHNYRFGPFKPPPHAVHAYPHKPPMGIHYSSSPSQQQQQQLISVTYPSHHSQAPPPTMFTYPSGGGGNPPNRDDPPKQLQPHGGIYLGPPSISRGYVLHSMEQQGTHLSKFSDENPKYYPPPPTQMTLLRTGGGGVGGGHMNIHPALNIQPSQQVVLGYDARNKKDSLQAPISFQGNSSGSITSGYPIRTTPTGNSFQGRPPSPQIIYASNSQQRLNYSHGGQLSSSPHAQQQQQQQSVTVARYSIAPGMQRDRDRERD